MDSCSSSQDQSWDEDGMYEWRYISCTSASKYLAFSSKPSVNQLCLSMEATHTWRDKRKIDDLLGSVGAMHTRWIWIRSQPNWQMVPHVSVYLDHLISPDGNSRFLPQFLLGINLETEKISPVQFTCMNMDMHQNYIYAYICMQKLVAIMHQIFLSLVLPFEVWHPILSTDTSVSMRHANELIRGPSKV